MTESDALISVSDAADDAIQVQDIRDSAGWSCVAVPFLETRCSSNKSACCKTDRRQWPDSPGSAQLQYWQEEFGVCPDTHLHWATGGRPEGNVLPALLAKLLPPSHVHR